MTLQSHPLQKTPNVEQFSAKNWEHSLSRLF